MNYLFATPTTPINVALKVCEACGALWLRARSHGAYCFTCAHWLAEFPLPRGPRRTGWARRRRTRATNAAPFDSASQPALATAGGAQ